MIDKEKLKGQIIKLEKKIDQEDRINTLNAMISAHITLTAIYRSLEE